jgi:ribA/ribD-fused uncharacterized protein
MPHDEIDEFQGEYRWLSNFWVARVELDGVFYPTVENAYQAAKAPPGSREPFVSCTPTQAKKMGRVFEVEDWPARKVGVMRALLAEKFAHGTPMAERLLATGAARLVEGNAWGDVFWGVCKGRGENMLGRLLMARRDVLRGLPEPEIEIDPALLAPRPAARAAEVASDGAQGPAKSSILPSLGRMTPAEIEDLREQNWRRDTHSQAIAIATRIILRGAPPEWPPVDGARLNLQTVEAMGAWTRRRIEEEAPPELRVEVAHEMNVMIERAMAANGAKAAKAEEERSRTLERSVRDAAVRKQRFAEKDRQRDQSSESLQKVLAVPVASSADALAGLQGFSDGFADSGSPGSLF